jgi:single-stranded DNA-binding protein
VQGRLQTGSYKNKSGDKVYTMDVIADRIEFLQWKSQKDAAPDNQRNFSDEEMPDSFKQIDEDIPF